MPGASAVTPRRENPCPASLLALSRAFFYPHTRQERRPLP